MFARKRSVLRVRPNNSACFLLPRCWPFFFCRCHLPVRGLLPGRCWDWLRSRKTGRSFSGFRQGVARPYPRTAAPPGCGKVFADFCKPRAKAATGEANRLSPPIRRISLLPRKRSFMRTSPWSYWMILSSVSEPSVELGLTPQHFFDADFCKSIIKALNDCGASHAGNSLRPRVLYQN